MVNGSFLAVVSFLLSNPCSSAQVVVDFFVCFGDVVKQLVEGVRFHAVEVSDLVCFGKHYFLLTL